MTRRVLVSWKSVLGTLGLIGTLLVIGALTLQPNGSVATAASTKPVSGAVATTVAKNTEKLHANHSKVASEEDAQPLMEVTGPTLISPEMAMDAAQKSNSTLGGVSSVDLTKNAAGQPMYVVHGGTGSNVVVDVDAQTGAIIVSGGN